MYTCMPALCADTPDMHGASCRSAPQLQHLDLTDNMVQQHKAYHLHLTRTLHQLAQLDGMPIKHEHHQGGAPDATLLTCGTTQWHSESGRLFAGWVLKHCRHWALAAREVCSCQLCVRNTLTTLQPACADARNGL